MDIIYTARNTKIVRYTVTTKWRSVWLLQGADASNGYIS